MTNGDYRRVVAEKQDPSLRTLDQVKDSLAQARKNSAKLNWRGSCCATDA